MIGTTSPVMRKDQVNYDNQDKLRSKANKKASENSTADLSPPRFVSHSDDLAVTITHIRPTQQ